MFFVTLEQAKHNPPWKLCTPSTWNHLKIKNYGSSTPTKLKVAFAGLTNALKLVDKGFIKNVFAQLAVPTIKIMCPLPRLLTNRFTTAKENSSTHELLHSSICCVSRFHWPLQSVTHSPCWASYNKGICFCFPYLHPSLHLPFPARFYNLYCTGDIIQYVKDSVSFSLV